MIRKDVLQIPARLLVALGAAMAISAAFVSLAGESPAAVLRTLAVGGLVGKSNLLRTLRWGTSYMFTGIAAAFAFRAGTFNVGIEGCVYLGGLTAALVGQIPGLPWFVHIPLAMVAAAAAGLVWLSLPAYLKAYHGINEVITTWMSSYIGVLLAQYLVTFRFQDPFEHAQAAQQVRTAFVQTSARLPQLFPPHQLSAAFLIALVLALLFYWFCSRTVPGYEMEMVGLSPTFAQYGGIDVARSQFLAIVVSGAIGGLAGAMEILGTHHRYIHGFSQGLGYDGVMVALMGRLNPVAVPIAGLFLGFLKNGARAVERGHNVPLDTVTIMISVVVIFITAEGLYEMLRVKTRVREEE